MHFEWVEPHPVNESPSLRVPASPKWDAGS